MSDEAAAVPPPPDPNAPLTGAARTINRQALLVIIWVCFSVATCFLALRMTVRWRQNARLLPDDYWMTWAWMCMLTMTVLQTQQMEALWYMTYVGAGRIAYDPESMGKNHYQLTRWQFPIIKLFWITIWSVKASFLSLFFRLIQGFPILRRLWYAVCVFAALALIGCILASTLTCSPPSDYFHGEYMISILRCCTGVPLCVLIADTSFLPSQVTATRPRRYGCRPSTSSTRPRLISPPIS